MEWNNECRQLQLIHVTGAVQSSFALSTMSLALLSHYRGCVSKSSVVGILLSGNMISQSENVASLKGIPRHKPATLLSTQAWVNLSHSYQDCMCTPRGFVVCVIIT